MSIKRRFSFWEFGSFLYKKNVVFARINEKIWVFVQNDINYGYGANDENSVSIQGICAKIIPCDDILYNCTFYLTLAPFSILVLAIYNWKSEKWLISREFCCFCRNPYRKNRRIFQYSYIPSLTFETEKIKRCYCCMDSM